MIDNESNLLMKLQQRRPTMKLLKCTALVLLTTPAFGTDFSQCSHYLRMAEDAMSQLEYAKTDYENSISGAEFAAQNGDEHLLRSNLHQAETAKQEYEHWAGEYRNNIDMFNMSCTN